MARPGLSSRGPNSLFQAPQDTKGAQIHNWEEINERALSKKIAARKPKEGIPSLPLLSASLHSPSKRGVLFARPLTEQVGRAVPTSGEGGAQWMPANRTCGRRALPSCKTPHGSQGNKQPTLHLPYHPNYSDLTRADVPAGPRMQNAHASPPRQKAEKEQLGNGPRFVPGQCEDPLLLPSFSSPPHCCPPQASDQNITPQQRQGGKRLRITVVAWLREHSRHLVHMVSNPDSSLQGRRRGSESLGRGKG